MSDQLPAGGVPSRTASIMNRIVGASLMQPFLVILMTLILTGGLTDVCVHYTFVDGHQHNYHCRVVEDCVGGSSQPAHDAALQAMEYLQTGARCSSATVPRSPARRTACSSTL